MWCAGKGVCGMQGKGGHKGVAVTGERAAWIEGGIGVQGVCVVAGENQGGVQRVVTHWLHGGYKSSKALQF